MSLRPHELALNLLLQHVLTSPLLAGTGLRVGMLRADFHPELLALARHPAVAGLQLQSTFKPHVDALAAAGLEVVPALHGDFDLLLFVPTKQRRESLACLAEAVGRLAPGGRLVVSCANEMGAATYEKNLRSLAGLAGHLSKSHCRVFWSDGGHVDRRLQQEWQAAAQPSRIPGTPFQTVPGIYGWNKIDRGSALLAEQIPADLGGEGMDLGCNYGYLSYMLLRKAPGVRRLHLVEAEARALDCARLNLAEFDQARLQCHWAGVDEPLPQDLDFVLVNPPFHTGKGTDYQLGNRFVEAACRALRRGGRLFLVANQFISYENVLDRQLSRHERVAQAEGFKVLAGVK